MFSIMIKRGGGTCVCVLISDCAVCAENGLLSYENPNYHLDPARLDDALNSNTEEDPLYSELLLRELSLGRRQYASLDIGSMGVDVTAGPVTTLDTDNRHHRSVTTTRHTTYLLSSHLLVYINSLYTCASDNNHIIGTHKQRITLQLSLLYKPYEAFF